MKHGTWEQIKALNIKAWSSYSLFIVWRRKYKPNTNPRMQRLYLLVLWCYCLTDSGSLFSSVKCGSGPDSWTGLVCWSWEFFAWCEHDASRCLYSVVLLPFREGSRLYSYLLIGQNHYPETTQPTTSPRTNIRKALQYMLANLAALLWSTILC